MLSTLQIKPLCPSGVYISSKSHLGSFLSCLWLVALSVPVTAPCSEAGPRPGPLVKTSSCCEQC